MLEIRKSENLLQQLQNDHLLIVIIDDDSNHLMLLNRNLTKLGIFKEHIIDFDNPLNLLEFVKKTTDNIAVIISDLEMPQMNGFELFIELVKMRFAGEFIIYSGADQDSIKKDKERFPADSFVNVPIVEKTTSVIHDRHQIQHILESLICIET